MLSKFLTFLTILVLFLSAPGLSAERLKRQAKCTTLTTDITLTTSAASSPGCAYNIAAPTVTAVSCGSCDSSGSSAAAPAQFLKRQDSSCITVMTNISTIITTASCTVTVVAPTATVTGCGTC